MTLRALLCTASFAGLLTLQSGCGETGPIPGTDPLEPEIEEPVDSVTASFPPAPGDARVYDRETPSQSGSLSRYVLYADGAFELQYLSQRWGFFAYPGDYSRSGSSITFDFDGSNSAGPWIAEGRLEGIRLHVEYNIVMILADFENGTYILQSSD